MSGELETAALDSAGGWLRWKRKHADIPVGTPCANCEVPLQGTYCYNCGQLAEDFHRNSWHLLVEAVESLLHLDGRLFKTLPGLIWRPGQLTRDYLEGKRAWQVQPFRMFLVILLIVLFVGHLATKSAEHKAEAQGGDHSTTNLVVPADSAAASDLEKARAQIQADPDMSASEKAAALAATRGDWAAFSAHIAENARETAAADDGHRPASSPPPAPSAATATATADGENLHVNSRILEGDDPRLQGFKHWAEARLTAVKDDPERFALIMEIWLHRVAILALPVSALMLSLLFIFNRRYFVFDHLIFSMHSLSFQMLLVTVILLLSMIVGGAAWWLILIMPVHLYVHMKGAYQRSAFGTVARMSALFFLTNFTFGLLALLWLYLAFNEMAGH
ncbi:MAG TPA: DUF3667 domain-containing protein [Brevundimonas sp.]|jgi:hypothetical protein